MAKQPVLIVIDTGENYDLRDFRVDVTRMVKDGVDALGLGEVTEVMILDAKDF